MYSDFIALMVKFEFIVNHYNAVPIGYITYTFDQYFFLRNNLIAHKRLLKMSKQKAIHYDYASTVLATHIARGVNCQDQNFVYKKREMLYVVVVESPI